MAPNLNYLCGMAAAMYVATSLVVAAVRWFHMCRPYDQKPRYYYPGRPFVIGTCLNSLLLLPFLLHPESIDAWYLARVYFLPVIQYHFTLLLFSYFGNVMEWRNWRVTAVISGLPVALALLVSVTLAIWPGDQIGGSLMSTFTADGLLYILGLTYTVMCFAAIVVVFRWARKIDEDAYSNPADFPVVSARKWVLMALINVVFSWVGVLSGRHALLAVVMLLFSVAMVIFIITALHPNRNRPVEDLDEDPSADSAAGARIPQPALLAAIHSVMEKEEAFLDPHLTIQDIADRCGYSRSYVASVFKTEFGGFFTYVNELRVAHVEEYLRENPGGTVQEAAELSGFVSRQAYYSVKAKLQEKKLCTTD